jgi:hypothetical protein
MHTCQCETVLTISFCNCVTQAADSSTAAAGRRLDYNVTNSATAADAVANALQALAVVPVVQNMVRTTPCPLGHYCPPTAAASDR